MRTKKVEKSNNNELVILLQKSRHLSTTCRIYFPLIPVSFNDEAMIRQITFMKNDWL